MPMHGIDQTTQELFAYRTLEQRVPQAHPLRPFKSLVDSIRRAIGEDFAALYSTTGRASIPPERLGRASPLQVLHTLALSRCCVGRSSQPAVPVVCRPGHERRAMGRLDFLATRTPSAMSSRAVRLGQIRHLTVRTLWPAAEK